MTANLADHGGTNSDSNRGHWSDYELCNKNSYKIGAESVISACTLLKKKYFCNEMIFFVYCAFNNYNVEYLFFFFQSLLTFWPRDSLENSSTRGHPSRKWRSTLAREFFFSQTVSSSYPRVTHTPPMKTNSTRSTHSHGRTPACAPSLLFSPSRGHALTSPIWGVQPVSRSVLYCTSYLRSSKLAHFLSATIGITRLRFIAWNLTVMINAEPII